MPGEDGAGDASGGRKTRFAPKIPAGRRRRAADPDASARGEAGRGRTRRGQPGLAPRGRGQDRPRDIVTFGGELAFGQVEAAPKARRTSRTTSKDRDAGPSNTHSSETKEESLPTTKPSAIFAAEKNLETEYDSDAKVEQEEDRLRSSVPPGFAPISVPSRALETGRAVSGPEASYIDQFPVDSVAYHIISAASVSKPLFIQLPSTLPFAVPVDEALKSAGQDHPVIVGSKLDMVPPHALRPDLRLMKPGVTAIGKLRMFRSGKVQIVVVGSGTNGEVDQTSPVVFDVLGGAALPSEHNLVQIDVDEGKVMSLAQVERKFVCVPRLDELTSEPS